MQNRLECKIFGRVQLVMFRDFAKRKADKLGLLGTVENMDDGAVFVVAEGEKPKLEEFLKYLKKGPIFAKVSRIETEWFPATGTFNDFRILFYSRRRAGEI